MLPKIIIPTRNEVDSYKKTPLPTEIVNEDNLCSCEINTIIKQTVDSLLDISNIKPDPNDMYYVDSKFGLDGSGSHNYRHQLTSNEEDDLKGTNYIASFWCPLSIKDRNGQKIWSNPMPNSIIYARPVTIVKAKETRGSIEEHFKPSLTSLKTNETVPLTSESGFVFRVKTEISMVD